MSWFKVDDGFWSNPKVIGMSEGATSLWVRAGSYSCQHLTDGFIPTTLLRLLGTAEAAAELVTVGLWHEAEGGFTFHDWDEYQETSDAVKARRDASRERQRRRRMERDKPQPDSSQDSQVSRRDSGVTHAGVTPVSQECSQEVSTPDPTRPDPTRPDPLTPSGVSGGAAQAQPARKRATRLPDGWMPDRDVIEAMRTECPYVDLGAEHRKFCDYWAAKAGKDATKVDWNATWRNWIRRAGEDAPVRASGRPSAARSWADIALDMDGPSQPVLDANVIDIRGAG